MKENDLNIINRLIEKIKYLNKFYKAEHSVIRIQFGVPNCRSEGIFIDNAFQDKMLDIIKDQIFLYENQIKEIVNSEAKNDK